MNLMTVVNAIADYPDRLVAVCVIVMGAIALLCGL